MANPLAVAGTNSKYKHPDASPAGFWAGVWHGLIAPIVFIVSLFNSSVGIYEINNNGRWYDFGFMIGISGSLGGGGASSV
ncbi:MAG: hypothetical protein JRD93_20880 [Deltaproteobacteria bacterium]|nr:hypothetical protein [Deltaproteobacteria bacterium]